MTTAPPTIDVGSTAVEIHARAVEFARCVTWRREAAREFLEANHA